MCVVHWSREFLIIHMNMYTNHQYHAKIFIHALDDFYLRIQWNTIKLMVFWPKKSIFIEISWQIFTQSFRRVRLINITNKHTKSWYSFIVDHCHALENSSFVFPPFTFGHLTTSGQHSNDMKRFYVQNNQYWRMKMTNSSEW